MCEITQCYHAKAHSPRILGTGKSCTEKGGCEAALSVVKCVPVHHSL